MYKYLIVSIIITLSCSIYSQDLENDSIKVSVSLEGNALVARDTVGEVVDSWTFHAPELYRIDLDGDESDEIVIIDNNQKNNLSDYTLYIFTVENGLELADSLYSGRLEPVIEFNEELNSTLICTGIHQLDSLLYLTGQDTIIVPRRYSVFDGNEIINVSSDLYSYYMDQNDAILGDYTSLVENGTIECNEGDKLMSIIFTVYYNYLQAGENSLANNFLSSYHSCPKFSKLKSLLDSL
jgi:hypothetical protein